MPVLAALEMMEKANYGAPHKAIGMPRKCVLRSWDWKPASCA